MARAQRVKVGDDVRIEWADAAATHPEVKDGPWSDEGTELVDICRCRTLGIVAAVNAETIVVVQTLAEDGGYTSDFAIPRGCITKLKVL